MISAQGLKTLRQVIRFPSYRSRITHQYRNYARATVLLPRHSSPPFPTLTKSPWRSAPIVTCLRSSLQASRFASTASHSHTLPDPISSVADPAEDHIIPTIDDITSDIPLAPENIGYLKDLGLDYGWGPTALIEYLLEHVHIYTATPWWASIILTALLVRLAFLKPYFDAADLSARMATIRDLVRPIQTRMDAAKATKDQAALMQGVGEMQALYRQAGIKMWKAAIPILQAPIGYGTFRLLKGMANLPVPGLEDGGFLWIKDLTIADPYCILPLVTGVGVYFTFKIGGEMGNASIMNPAFAKFATYGMPVLAGGFMLMYPACMQLTFGFTALLSLIQARLLRQPWVRERLGIQQLPKRVPNTERTKTMTSRLNMYQTPAQMLPPVEARGGLAGKAREKISEAKGAASELMKSARALSGSTATPARKLSAANSELEKAQALQERRLNQIAQARSKAGQRRHEEATQWTKTGR